MFVEIQYPIADYRALIKKNNRLSAPSWPNPKSGEMLRNFGSIVSRIKGGAEEWDGENLYCFARKGLKFPNLEKHRIELPDRSFLKPEGRTRRINSNGKFLVKVELGFHINLEDYIFSISKNRDYFKSVLLAFCKIKLIVKGNKLLSRTVSLSNAGHLIAKSYLNSTSKKCFWKFKRYRNEWVESISNPMLIVIVHNGSKEIELPHGVIKVVGFEDKKISLYSYWLNKKYHTWIIKKHVDYTRSNDSFVRDLRLNLLRINSEIEVLRGLLAFIGKKHSNVINIEEYYNKLSRYFECVTSKLLKEERYGIKQKEVLSKALSAFDEVHIGERKSFSEQVNNFNNDYVTTNLKKLRISMIPSSKLTRKRKVWGFVSSLVFVLSLGLSIYLALNFKDIFITFKEYMFVWLGFLAITILNIFKVFKGKDFSADI